MKKNILFVAIIAISTLALLSFNFYTADNDPWPVPEKYENMKNPEEANTASLKVGKDLYNKHCKSCHGKEGLGDGSKAAQLDTPAGDFTDESFISQSDGALFYKSKFGRDEMPSFEKKIPYDEDIWHIVNWMRTLE